MAFLGDLSQLMPFLGVFISQLMHFFGIVRREMTRLEERHSFGRGAPSEETAVGEATFGKGHLVKRPPLEEARETQEARHVQRGILQLVGSEVTLQPARLIVAHGVFERCSIGFPGDVSAPYMLEVLIAFSEKIHDARTLIRISEANGLTNGFFSVRDNLV